MDTNDFSESELKQNAQFIMQSQTYDQVLKLHNAKKSMESDFELNNRVDESSNYQQSVVGRKSKVSQFSKANTNAIESNLNFIENHLNQNPHVAMSNNKSPFSQQDRKSGPPMSPTANNTNQGAIPQSTQKSFYKNQNMAKTGMSGAPNPKMTGSSFYNATMAKTKI